MRTFTCAFMLFENFHKLCIGVLLLFIAWINLFNNVLLYFLVFKWGCINFCLYFLNYWVTT